MAIGTKNSNVKVSKFQKQFLVSSILQKKTNKNQLSWASSLLRIVIFIRFLGELRKPWFAFEIVWPLETYRNKFEIIIFFFWIFVKIRINFLTYIIKITYYHNCCNLWQHTKKSVFKKPADRHSLANFCSWELQNRYSSLSSGN